ncbi:uncharacterized protein MELLADRAFT_113973 [Melampsora larici-populina 98AG31]|uniref:Uncharacterized protein n=1 Tax=Melampsora larici-populina (strain 98AG31 / pathotype 3-4-7) TaxID=747676 RepID=F4SBQ1_MELLP|nr:uncharacterized protein MELLADRAFT_113973 [Melampsora larici-populina 98AG31]EGF97927.1 hypothetical protein MELLADRAFT_113973 [Melampsora larici-populina 98AG31]
MKPLVYPCLWCPKKPCIHYDSNSNLKQHRDGYAVGRVRKPCAVKGGLVELGRTVLSRHQQRKSILGVFPIPERLPVIAEEDEEESHPSAIVIEDDEDQTEAEEMPLPDEEDTDHDSECEETACAPPDYDEAEEDRCDREDVNDIAPETSTTNDFKNNTSRKHALRLNALMAQANFISRRVARSAPWRRYFTRVAKSMNLKLLPLTPGYNATRWKAEFDSLNRLVQARKFYEQAFGPQHPHTIRAGTLLQEKFAQRQKTIGSPQTDVPASTSDSNSTTSAKTSSDVNVFQLFKAQEPQAQVDEMAAYLKGTHPMSAKDDARECNAILPWWSVRITFWLES